MSKQLIINADELGLTEQVNRAIIEAHEAGVVTSTTLIVNMWSFDNAVELAGRYPALGVGIHLNLTDGSPVSRAREVPTLVRKDGRFFRRRELLIRLSLRQVDPVEVRRELRAQMNKLQKAGIVPTHIDCHQHVHLHPRLLSHVLKLAQEFGLPIRLPEETILHRGRSWPPREVVRYLRKRMAIRLAGKARAEVARLGVRTTDHFLSPFGIFPEPSSVTSEDLAFLIENIREGTTELMVHPGYVDDRLRSFSALSDYRLAELRAITNHEFRELLRRSGVQLVTFGALNGS